MHFHAYTLQANGNEHRLRLASRSSTDAQGVAKSLGLQANATLELEVILDGLQRRLSRNTVFSI
jgi:hypothetical protein